MSILKLQYQTNNAQNTLHNMPGSRVTKHLSVSLALKEALYIILLICGLKLNLLSQLTPRSVTAGTSGKVHPHILYTASTVECSFSFDYLSASLYISFIWHAGIPKRIGKTQFCFYGSNVQSILCILQKFSEIRISDPGV